jgi:uracil-DNA glycosylase family 4
MQSQTQTKKISIKIPSTYKEYHSIVETENFERDNILVNTHGSITVKKPKIKYLYSALYFSNDKDAADGVLNLVRQLKTFPDLMNSRCYPTGFWSKNNVMILGMAPGRKGRSIDGYDLKPSFVYTQTSFYLRKAIERTFGGNVPYITNTLKHATHSNQVTENDFETCRHILEYEIHVMNPQVIIALGNQVYDYISQWKARYNFGLVKIMHPAAAIYSGINHEQYSEKFNRTYLNAII